MAKPPPTPPQPPRKPTSKPFRWGEDNPNNRLMSWWGWALRRGTPRKRKPGPPGPPQSPGPPLG